MIAFIRKALLIASVAGIAIAFVLGALVMNRLAAEDGYHDQMLADWQNQHSQ